MKLIKQITDLNKAINKENNLGFIPTMGSIHKGHEFLIKESRRLCNKTLVSIFINPTQFNNKVDYKSYPRNLNQDLKVLKKLKVDYVFLPTVNQIYKQKRFSKITLNKSQRIMCAKFRKGHFEGVLDVLDRFIKRISPKIMFMGEKDYQQLAIIRKLVHDLNIPIEIIGVPTLRNTSGLALSSRNNYLNAEQLKQAAVLYKTLQLTADSIKLDKNPNYSELEEAALENISSAGLKPDYFSICDAPSLFPATVNDKDLVILAAAYLGNTRLIDNISIKLA